MENNKTYDVLKAALAQLNYCRKIGFKEPFAPKSGCCYRCGHNIYTHKINGDFGTVISTGYSVELAGKHLITGCPHCNASFVD